MMSRRMLLAAVLLSAVPLAAQSPIEGAWTAEVPLVVKTVDGVQTVEATTTITLTLTVRGDSVTGTISRPNSAITRPVTGLVKGDSVTLRMLGKAQVNVNGSDQLVELTTIYRLRRMGDVLAGTTETRRENPSTTDLTTPGLERDPQPVTLRRRTG